MATLDLTGLSVQPDQVWGGVRLVPLVRDEPIETLRLHAKLYGTEAAFVAVDKRSAYTASYVPHGFVATWTEDGAPAAAYGTEMVDAIEPCSPVCVPVRYHRRMARRTDKNRLRFLPMHLAVEGYLALHFGGPEILWEQWSQRAIRNGLSPRAEETYTGAQVNGLADALRIFEIHPGQCGALVYVADALAAAFVVPHPDDYRALHPTLITDLYGELIYHYAMLTAPVPQFHARLSDTHVNTLADLRAAVARQRSVWPQFHDTMVSGLLDAQYSMRRVYRLGDYSLTRFLPGFLPKQDNHIGELITDQRGRTAYLKTFRLSEKQVRRGYLLQQLAAHDWHMPSTAEALGTTEAQLGLRLESAGFGHLLNEHTLAHYRATQRKPQRR
ncbi:hypothetical protein ALI144C_40710 [Actinosynnema sp. ALI-1.44]|uniref:ARPP-2 domain-containing protein n=1 Tax=Actinosynnema sp. ALI-1.44 TaxID=1933779 RepID=UPI00097C8B96|nr:hypothetical protein [Actinosynnema sp. ALI-1.44]ONI75084.1 hypothetical protein ALI144C_40710 [Actinosynnema sp. ALI-1.44]